MWFCLINLYLELEDHVLSWLALSPFLFRERIDINSIEAFFVFVLCVCVLFFCLVFVFFVVESEKRAPCNWLGSAC